MEIVESVVIGTSAQALFAIYGDVARWHEWDPDTRAASIEGEFVQGARGRLVPSKGLPVPMRLLTVVPGKEFTVESRVLFSAMLFGHVLEALPEGVRATHWVAFRGPCAWFLRWLVGGRIRRGLPLTMRSLKAYAETGAGATRAAVPDREH